MKDTGWQVLLSGSILSAGLVLSYLFNFVSKEYLLAIVVIVCAMLIFSIFFNFMMFKILLYPRVCKELTDTVNETKKSLTEARQLLRNVHELILDRERRCFSTWAETTQLEELAKEIWILTPDFYWDLNNTKYSELVKRKIKDNGDKYWWLYPQQLQGQAEDLEKTLELTPATKDVLFTPISGAMASHFPHEVVIYDPNDNKKRVVLICDFNGKKRDSPDDSLDLPIWDSVLGLQYCRLFLELGGKSTPSWYASAHP